MKFSQLLTVAFGDSKSLLIEECLKHFSITYFVLSYDAESNVRVVAPSNMAELEDENTFCVITKDYMFTIYGQTEKEMLDKFARFLKLKAFI